MAVCVRGTVPTDWSEAAKMAESKEYGIGSQFEGFRSNRAVAGRWRISLPQS